MKVLHLGKFYPPDVGGIETVMEGLVEELNRAGVTTDVLCAKRPKRRYPDSVGEYQIFRAPTLAILLSTAIAPAMVVWLARIHARYDIIHLHFPDPMAIMALWIVRPRAKLIIHWHSDIIKQRVALKFFQPFLRWVVARADRVIGATSSHIEESDYAPWLRGKSAVIPFFLKPRATVEAPKYRALRSDETITILSVGRLVYYKGLEYLIEAMRWLPKRFELSIIGEGERHGALKEQIRALGLEGRVRLEGRVSEENLARAYQESHLFCLPSTFRSEMFGMVQLEAMRWGKPVVSTLIERSGVRHVNREGETGFRVMPRDAKALASAIERVVADEARYNTLAQNAYRHSLHYTPEVVIPQILKLYREVLDS